ncbi:MAG: hypothetical protein Q7S01_03915 [bacterium]|nr:hypothetical protein [bacterium]
MKSLVWFGAFAGSTIGSLIPGLWGSSMFSFSSILLGGVGAFLGIWIAYQYSQD